ncbi:MULTISPECIES: hypothetical protein [unclassified Pseudomonas]|uniref:hypothetical protein n=2 Tax=unclassified Pseudomonas TaxID=196821 RepID=UPI000BA44CA7|nr:MULTISPECIES: hypothetical protein [unclassified Pseudomonas]MCU1725232.1 hypothetical protein [Pseudomonas sp. 5P_5.1_Bac1]
MDNIIRNGDFRQGLADWKANHLVNTAEDGGLHYAYFGQGIQIRQAFSGLEGGTDYLFRLETSALPLENDSSLSFGDSEPSTWPVRSDGFLLAYMSVSLFDGAMTHIITRRCVAYPSWGLAAFRFTAPVGFKSGIATIVIPSGESQPDIEMGVTNVEIIKALNRK